MAEPESAARALFRVGVVLVVTASALAGVPVFRSGADPETLVREVSVAPRALLSGSTGPGLSLVEGELRATAAARTSRTRVCAPIWATGLGVTWTQRTAGEVHVRLAVEGSGGAPRPWVELDAHDDADPGTADAVAGRRGSSFLWTGGNRCVRLALELRPGARVADVRVVFVNSSGTAAGPGTGPVNRGPALTDPAAGSLGVAWAFARRPRIVTREQWGADPKLMNCTPSVADEVRMGFVHHTAGSNSYSREEGDDVIRGVYAYHTNGRGWCDIGYNFLVDRYGTIYEGRSGGVDVPVIGAAQMGFNTRAFSVSVMGNFESAAVPRAVQRALVRLIAWRLDVAHVNPVARATMVSAGGSNTRYAQGEVVRLRTISGHRDTGFTACPGARLYSFVPKLRQRVAARGLPKIFKPRLSTDELTAGQPVDVRIRARGTEPLSWSVSALAPDGTPYARIGKTSGTDLKLTWSGDGPPAQPTVGGIYTVAITAEAADGSSAREALLPLTVLAPPPSPSPSPSP
ncbi:MAG TPA: peptidoglycan recognition protein [Actinomycetota bacterium]